MTVFRIGCRNMIHCVRANSILFCVLYLAVVLSPPIACLDHWPDSDEDYAEAKEAPADEKWLERVCPFGWQAVGDYCYLYVKQPGMQWTQAERYCADAVQGGHLASLHSTDEIELVFALITAAGSHWFHREHQTYHAFRAANDFVWVGLAYMCPEPSGGRWSDGTKLKTDIIKIHEPAKPILSYSYSSTGNPQGRERCVAYHLTADGGKLMKSYCLDFAPFLCKVRRDSNQTRPAEEAGKSKEDIDESEHSQCGSYDWCYYNGSCYKIQAKEQPWYESRSACLEDGGDLVSIHSVLEIDYLNNNLTIDWSAGKTFWTGLNKLESIDDRYQWTDNSPVDFLPAVSVEVKAGMAARNPSCVSIRLNQLRRLLAKTVAAGKMRGDEEMQLSRCDTTHPAICKKTLGKRVVSPSLTPAAPTVGGCPKGWLLYSGRCYRAFGVDNTTALERANFRDAYQTCSKYKANLVSIQNQFDNLFILSLLTGDDLNQSWIGLIYHEGRLRWLDETQVGFTNFDQIAMATFGLTRSTPAPSSAFGTTESYYRARTDFTDYLGYGSYSSAYLWRLQERCFVMSIDKAPGTWDPVSSSGSLSSIVSRVQPSSAWSSSALNRGKRSVYWPYDWRRSWTFTGESCEQLKLPFVCEKSKSANETWGEREWLCDVDTGGTENSSVKHGSNCYQVVTDTQLSWDDARTYCERSSPATSLVSILSQQEFAFLVSLMKKRDDLSQFWIGMRIYGEGNTTSVHAAWADQWPVWITKWHQYPQADNERSCVAMSATDENTVPSWRQEPCEKKLPFVCKHRKNKEEPPKPAVPGRCGVGWIAGSTQCYKIKKNEWTSGANAMLSCWREHNASLASFPTETDWLLISKSQDLKEVKRRFFIGLMQKVHGGFEWIDGRPLDYVNWAAGEPRYGWNPSVEVCVEMDQNGFWYDAGCHETRHFICSKPKDEDVSSDSPSSPGTVPSQSPSSLVPTPTSTSAKSTAPTAAPTTALSAPTSASPVQENSTNAGNQSESARPFSSRRSLQKKKTASQPGVIAGIVICAIVVMAVFALGATYLYRRHTQGFPLFRRRSSDTMRFEILNERNDEY